MASDPYIRPASAIVPNANNDILRLVEHDVSLKLFRTRFRNWGARCTFCGWSTHSPAPLLGLRPWQAVQAAEAHIADHVNWHQWREMVKRHLGAVRSAIENIEVDDSDRGQQVVDEACRAVDYNLALIRWTSYPWQHEIPANADVLAELETEVGP